MLKSVWRGIVALGTSLVFAVVPAQARTPAVAHPALWEVSDPDTRIYLFGTIHLLPANYQWQTPKFQAALADSQQLVIETIVDDKNPTKIMSALASLAFAKGLPPLAQRVPPEQRPALAIAIKQSGIPAPVFDQMKTWAAGFMLLANQFRQLGLKGNEGPETILRNSFTSQGKGVGELESNVEQLGFFDRLPEPAQQALLLGAFEQPDNMKKEFAGMLASWSKGDVKGIARTFDRDLGNTPALQQALVAQRNANWKRWIEQRLAQPGSVMVAVGAGHLAGEGSVIDLLKRDGYQVRRLQ
jgi:uncharacterized protein YbaP (TraB family)